MKWIKLVHVLLLNKVSTFIIIKNQNKVCSTCVSLSLQFFEPRGNVRLTLLIAQKVMLIIVIIGFPFLQISFKEGVN